MSTFNESEHPRHGDGQWATKTLDETDPGLGEGTSGGTHPIWKEPLYWRNVLRPVLAEARSDARLYLAHADRSNASSARASVAAYNSETAEGCQKAADMIRDTPPQELQERLAELRTQYRPPGAYNYIDRYSRMLRGVEPPPRTYYSSPDEATVSEANMARAATAARDDAVIQPPHGPGSVYPGSPMYLDPAVLNEAADIIEASTPDNVVERLEDLRSRSSGEATRFVADYINEVQGLAPEFNGRSDLHL